MRLSSLFRDELILPGVRVRSKEDAIRILAGKIAETHRVLDESLILAKILEREAMASTTFPNGVAVPHARIERFEDLVVAVLVPEKPVDGARIMFLILTDLARSNLYLNVLAAISTIGQVDRNIDLLVSARSPGEFIRTLESFGLSVKKTVHVADLMNAPPIFLHPGATVKDALDFLSVNRFGYIPICDDTRMFLGEVTVWDILSAGLPQYARTLTNLKFLSSLEPFEELLKNEAAIPLRSIMRTPPITLSPRAIVFEAAFQFVKHNRCHFPVVDKGECVGVMSYMDLVNKFLRV